MLSLPHIQAMGLPRKVSLLTSPGFHLGAAGTSPVFHQNFQYLLSDVFIVILCCRNFSITTVCELMRDHLH